MPPPDKWAPVQMDWTAQDESRALGPGALDLAPRLGLLASKRRRNPSEVDRRMAIAKKRLRPKAQEPARQKEPGERKFERHLPAARRQALIEATLRCLAREGHDGLSVRRIASEAGVSLGLMNHHFPSKVSLVAAAYRHLHAKLSDALRRRIAEAGPTPRERFAAYLDASFSPPNLDPDVLSVWVVFWSMSRHTAEISAVHNETYKASLDGLIRLFSELADEEGLQDADARLAAIALTSLTDGLWLEWCLNPRTFSAAEAIAVCQASIDAFVAAGKRHHDASA